MVLNSCLYDVDIWHSRQGPKKYSFDHKIFMFYLDLDELPSLSQASWMLGYNRHRIYNFRDEDHVLSLGKTAKASVVAYVRKQGVASEIARVKLLTNLRTFGYIFNPVSFYFCFDANDKPLCVVPQIGNTFGELKYFFLGANKLNQVTFKDQQTKYYYISPFIDLDNILDFKIQMPDDGLDIKIDVLKNGEKFFYSSMKGKKKALTTVNLLKATLMCPFVTLKVIFLIHWHAAVLHFIKNISHHPKESNPHLQKEVWREWKKV